jgi:hypothetical protein
MTEGLFVLIVIYAAYVLDIVFNQKNSVKLITPVENLSYESSSQKEQPKITNIAASKTLEVASTEKTLANKQTKQKKGLKDPKSGDIATTYNNYRFTKRWIKEALVTEGLLEKVYKNSELNAETETSFKAAIAKLEALEQYKI